MATNKKKKRKSSARRVSPVIVIVLLIAALLFGGAFCFKDMLPASVQDVLTQIEAFFQTSDSGVGSGGTPAGQIDRIPAVTENGYLSVHYIDVGQGDSILLTCSGATMLIDAGNNGKGNIVVSYLQDLQIEKLDLVVGTHGDSDHIGGLDEVLAVIPADEVWYEEYRSGTKTETSFLSAAEACGATVRQPSLGETYALGDATVTVLGPVKCDYSQGSTDYYTDKNDMSIVLMVQYGENKFLFTGDMEKTDGAEGDLVEYWGAEALKADVLKVGHHGSDTSTSYALLRAVDPAYAVICVGEGNSYGHPKQDTLDILGQADIYTYRTDLLGAIVAVSDGTSVKFGWTNTAAEPYIPTKGE